MKDSFFKPFHEIIAALNPRAADTFAVGDLPHTAAALLTASLAAPNNLTLLITAAPLTAERLALDLESLQKHPVLLFPPADDTEALTGARIPLVKELLTEGETRICVASIHALLKAIPDPKALQAASVQLALGVTCDLAATVEQLSALGYRRDEMVMEPLTFAVRGGILDIWAAGAEAPLRLECFGDEIDTLRLFDPATQRSTQHVKTYTITPAPQAKIQTVQILTLLKRATYVLYDHELIATALSQLPAVKRNTDNATWFYQRLSETGLTTCIIGDPPYPGLQVLPLKVEPIMGMQSLGSDTLHHPELFAQARANLLLSFDEQARRKGEHVLLTANSAASLELLTRDLPPDSPIETCVAPLSEGFTCANARLTLLTQNDLYPAKRAWHPPVRKSKAIQGQRLDYVFDVEPGELVVHLEHGIGRFIGLAEVADGDKRIEVFTLEYANGTKLHVPTTHAHLLSRYIGPNPKGVALSTLDGKRWQHAKDLAQRSIEDLAADLLETQARRRVNPGFACKLDSPWLADFEAIFPYQETPDQIRAIDDIKRDMSSTLPMDRLICGDAGYGKTEVAMRAAFIAVVNHKQVLLMAPTTILAEQHYETFSDRMSGFPIRIEVISRFRTQAQNNKTRMDAAEGKVDILIGTHALLSSKQSMKDLGLLVIDEEQRFGVAQKEQIKHLRSLVDVLTLSATPIPRTLYLSMTGARDLSLLQTPPNDRIAVDTSIHYDTDDVLLRVISAELNRGGQVFYLYNRVMTIGWIYDRVRKLFPKATIAVAHGQMPARELAAIMSAFEKGETQILITTTIVESGIDIPRANTILVDRADRFGIADLYQLRGRVGRSAVKGYACMLIPEHGIDSLAKERLQALKRHSGLGAGYTLALRDLEIRGAGNLLGAAQSGHIAAVGFGLYCQLLQRTIARLKGERPQLLVDVELALDFISVSPGQLVPHAAMLPYHYIEDEQQRMNIYRRLAEASQDSDVKALRQELIDRFGQLPDPVTRLLRLTKLRILAASKGIAKIEVSEGILTFYDARNRAPISCYKDITLTAKRVDDKLKRIEQVLVQFTGN